MAAGKNSERRLNRGKPSEEDLDPVAESVPCSCGHHDIDPTRDKYEQHNAWVNITAPVEWEPINRGTSLAKGVGVSRVLYEPQTDEMWGEEFER